MEIATVGGPGADVPPLSNDLRIYYLNPIQETDPVTMVTVYQGPF